MQRADDLDHLLLTLTAISTVIGIINKGGSFIEIHPQSRHYITQMLPDGQPTIYCWQRKKWQS